MVYLVTGRRRNDGWPFAGEVVAGSGVDAADLVRRWGIEPEFVQDVASGRVEFQLPDSGEADGGDEGGGDLPVGGGFVEPRGPLMRAPHPMTR